MEYFSLRYCGVWFKKIVSLRLECNYKTFDLYFIVIKFLFAIFFLVIGTYLFAIIDILIIIYMLYNRIKLFCKISDLIQ